VVHQLGASSKRRAPLATRIEYHRSLYRFLDRHRGSGVATLARFVRGLRTAIGLIGISLLAIGSRRARLRWAERWGLLLWHLRGCPAEPGLAGALLASNSSRRRESSGEPSESEEGNRS